MKIAASLYVLHPHFTSFALSSLLLLYYFTHSLTITLACQTKKMNNNEKLLFI